MGGYEKLRVLLNQFMHLCNQRENAGGRQRRLRLIEQIQPIATKTIVNQREEAFPVRLPVQGYSAIAVDDMAGTIRILIKLVDIGGEIVQALCA